MKPVKLFELLEERIREINLDHPIRIGVDGVDGSGKKFFADAFAQYLQRLNRSIIRSTIDTFHNPKKIRYQQGENSPKGYYEDSFNIDGLIENLLYPLGPKGSLKYKTLIFNYKTDSQIDVPFEIAQEDSILIFDGIFLFTPRLNPFWDMRIFLDVPFETTIERVKQRVKDQEYLGSGNIVKKYKTRYIPGQKIYFKKAEPKKKADIIIDNTDYTNPLIVK
ncbi:MAG: hypothetical protein US52_C0024G0006 [candidate division WS6 bacterium GW2011_GWA2_37_6]|uniref:Phosphoribulokinase/uridine kinase domain-containing protein n=1 Tax=candidate division WS6 bacterium GW2011_GWA2_37_6 TaxID=1619087 RepID=A0A0G0GZK5_9BACT|nr:MAG: hypothetical protein US52_C0024G0006 [candidate division WS6 bacterium GW2011_GWA2_37_6]